MRRVSAILLLALTTLAGCQQKTQGDVVRQAYENKADQIDAQADQQPNKIAKQIYKDRADSFREEGKDREKGIEGGEPSKSPNIVKPGTGQSSSPQ
jgi:hypothetical protein